MCHPRLQARSGCKPGTLAEDTIIAAGREYDRCPRAILRDATQTQLTEAHQAMRWARAKQQGSLACYVHAPMSARTEELVEIADLEMEIARDEMTANAIKAGRG